MRLSDLLGCTVVDADGVGLGRVRDVRLVQDGPIQGTFGAGLRPEGLIVGSTAIASRLGYERLDSRAPWLVNQIARALNRGSVHVPWPDIERIDQRVVHVDRRRADLHPPVPLSQLRPT